MRYALILLLAVAAVPSIARAQAPETIEYYATDTVGSIRIVFDVNGTVLGRQDFTPFGTPVVPSAPMPKEAFVGNEKDDETVLNYFHARMFQARTARFNRPDALFGGTSEPQRWNRYAYALNNPIRFTDPTGLQTQTVNCQLGSYWCPGQIQTGQPVSDQYFDPQNYGYHGGEEMAQAEAAYAENVTSVFINNVINWLTQKQAAVKAAVPTVTVKVNGVEQPCSVDNGCIKLGIMPLSPNAIGAAGEQIVRSLADIGEKAAFDVGGRTRIADGLLGDLITEIKNVDYQAYTQQLKDYVAFVAQNPGMTFDLWVRTSADLSGPLKAAGAAGLITIKTFIWP
ncbi:MAG TPA: RHS repeat-associated core domain-containing protein [Vicinamibacterales bacterium]|nr:RHS repeat-associated core domain-containing protein [Vicinamibacterales bacterium]